MFLIVGGSHNFGFPSRNSDYDIRGVYMAPTSKFLGIREVAREPTFEFMSKDKSLDVSVDEVGHYLRLVSESNGNRVEWPNSRLVIVSSPEFLYLKELVNSAGLSKKLINHYLNFARDLWTGKTGSKGIKRDLYTLRTYMAGLSILEDGEVIPDINELNKKCRYPLIGKLIEIKEKDESGAAEGYDNQQVARMVCELDSKLERSVENSQLPSKPDFRKINLFLRKLRMRNL